MIGSRMSLMHSLPRVHGLTFSGSLGDLGDFVPCSRVDDRDSLAYKDHTSSVRDERGLGELHGTYLKTRRPIVHR
jgi:hypothetical protein